MFVSQNISFLLLKQEDLLFFSKGLIKTFVYLRVKNMHF